MRSIKTISERRSSKLIKAIETRDRKIPKKVIASKKRYTGICSICDNAPTCIYKRDPKNPVLNCEEFTATLPNESIYVANSTSIKMNTKENEYSSNTNTTEYNGLCSNCENRETCIYPRPEGGVWSCEEYE